MKYDVVLDAFNTYFPHDTTPVSLVGVKQINLTQCEFNGILVSARLITFGEGENEERALLQDEKSMSILREQDKPWGGLLFVAQNVPPGERATFNCELVYG